MYGNPPGFDSGPDDPDTQRLRTDGGSGERQRAAIVLGVIAIVALVLVGVMVAVLGSSNGSPAPSRTVAGPKGPAVIATGGTPSGQPSVKPTTRRTPTASNTSTATSPSRPRNRRVSCPSGSPCTLPDDIGNALAALNDYRTSHGKKVVTGAVTGAARTCAVNEGNNCNGGYFWEPVGRSGAEVVSKIADRSDGRSWLLDDHMTSVQIGWAYIPSSQSFECAIISNA